jgi:hypothetical protein
MMLINVYATELSPPEPDFPHRLLGRRDRSDPELLPHLQGFIGYALSTGQGQMTQAIYHVMRHLQRVQQHYSLEVEDAALDGFAEWAVRANAICFLPDGAVRDPYGAVLLSRGEPAADPQAKVPYPADASQRKARSEAQLSPLRIRPPINLPPVTGAGEVLLREPAEVARRMLALCAVALRAESVASGRPIPAADIAERLPLAVAALSPREQAFLYDIAPEPQQVANFGWRYEALALLQWALGLTETLPLPTAVCDAPKAAQASFEHHSASFIAEAQLRPAAELLDALDLHYRMHWAMRQARIEQREPPSGLLPGVIAERHYALNWLVRFEDKPWDEVDTPT